MSTPRPRYIFREILGGPNHRYIRKVLSEDGETYVDAPPIVVPPAVLAERRKFAEPYIAEAKAALLGKPRTNLIQ
jgi:hypothetical protein